MCKWLLVFAGLFATIAGKLFLQQESAMNIPELISSRASSEDDHSTRGIFGSEGTLRGRRDIEDYGILSDEQRLDLKKLSDGVYVPIFTVKKFYVQKVEKVNDL
nr:unnamed protein product [Callosobruchus chinensis]